MDLSSSLWTFDRRGGTWSSSEIEVYKPFEGLHDQIDFVAENLGSRNVANLERIATALYVETEGYRGAARVGRIVELKPHVEIPLAEKAVEELDRLKDLASTRSLIISQSVTGPSHSASWPNRRFKRSKIGALIPVHTALFENQPIRRIYDEPTNTWWFSVVDVIKILTQQPDAKRGGVYWRVLKSRLRKEGSQTFTNCNALKMTAEDGKQRPTDCATPETLLRLVQFVPSPKAEPIKLWLAKVGYERMQELADPSLALNRARETYQKQGRSERVSPSV